MAEEPHNALCTLKSKDIILLSLLPPRAAGPGAAHLHAMGLSFYLLNRRVSSEGTLGPDGLGLNLRSAHY